MTDVDMAERARRVALPARYTRATRDWARGCREIVLLALLLAIGGARMAVAADAPAGEAVFARCKICHSLAADGHNGVGPNLHGVFGRKAGSVDHFLYSDAMRNSGVVWSDDTLARYLHDPRSFIPGNRMAFPGIKDDAEMAALLAYLHQATQ